MRIYSISDLHLDSLFNNKESAMCVPNIEYCKEEKE